MKIKNLLRKLILLLSSNIKTIRLLLIIDNYLYKIVSQSSVKVNKGIHPKHDIVRYNKWFASKIKKNWIILDIGCGHGYLTKYISNHCKQVIGIEINQKDHLTAKKINSNSNITYINADATTYDYNQIGNIDCIILSNVLEHIEYRKEFFKEIITKLNKKIHILIRVPSIERDWYDVYKKNLGIDYRLDSTHFIEYTKEEFFNEIKSFGLALVSFEMNFGEFYAVCKKE